MTPNHEYDFPNKDFLAGMVKNGITKEFIDQAEEFGRHLAIDDKLTSTQIRRIFGHIKKIENYDKSEKFIPQLLMLKPLLAYTQKRHGKAIKDLREILEKAIDVVIETKEGDKEEQLNRFRLFCKGFEAILAYHKANERN